MDFEYNFFFILLCLYKSFAFCESRDFLFKHREKLRLEFDFSTFFFFQYACDFDVKLNPLSLAKK